MPRARNEPTEPGSFNPKTTKKGNQAKAKFLLAVKGVEREIDLLAGKSSQIKSKRVEIIRRNIKARIAPTDKKLAAKLNKRADGLLESNGPKSFKDFIESIAFKGKPLRVAVIKPVAKGFQLVIPTAKGKDDEFLKRSAHPDELKTFAKKHGLKIIEK